MSTLAFYAQFIASKVGLNSLTVTWDIERITRSDGTRSALVTGGATTVAIGRRGLYGYLLSGADTMLYDYVATAITADATVDQKEVAALWTQYETDGVKPTVAGRTLDVSAGGEAGLDWANVGSPTTTVALTNTQINSVSGSIGGDVEGKVLGGGAGVFVADGVQVAASGGGSGIYSYTDTVDDGSNPLDGVFVQCATDSGFTNIVNATHTNGLGVFTVYSDIAGTHYLRLQLAGYTFPDQTVILA